MATYIQRVQTVVSFSQLEDEAVCNQRPPTFGPTSPVSDCPGHTLPLYCFASCVPSKLKYRRVASKDAISIMPDVDFESHTSTSSSTSDISCGSSSEDDTNPSLSANSFSASAGIPGRNKNRGANLLDAVLTALWDDRAERGLLRYDLSSCTTKAVPGGGVGFIAQLNEGRATKKRPTEFRVDQVCQPFDESKFNFKRAYAREVLFQFEQRGRNGRGRGPPAASCLVEAAQCGPSPNLVIINVSPIEYGHVLLVPRVMDNLPQLVDPSTMALALHFTKEADNASFRLGYNSLGAYATINHLHFQGYYLDATFPCELADTAAVQGITTRQGRINISRLAASYPVNGFVAELDSSVRMADGIAELAELVGGACVRMQHANVPHNLLITDSGRKVFIWPQCFAERQAKGLIPEAMLRSGVNPAAFEISGHLLLKHQQDYDAVCEPEVCALLAQASLPEQRFLQVAQLCFGGAAAKGGI